MTIIVISLLCIIATATAQFNNGDQLLGQSKDEIDFEAFKVKHSHTYNTIGENILRFNVYLDNKNKIDKSNERSAQGLITYRTGLNKYSDRLHTEIVKRMNGYRSSRKTQTKILNVFEQRTMKENLSALAALPISVDWRNQSYVSAIQDQGVCGSCWAFTAAGALEGQTAKKTKKLYNLSEQNLIDCTRTSIYNNLGCDGGETYRAFAYVKDNKGIDGETSYPYLTSDTQTCKYNATGKLATSTGYIGVLATETALQTAVANIGPIAVAIDASNDSFQMYAGGVYNEPKCSSTSLDHAVLVVGYGKDSVTGQDYWLIKNSWGTTWGEKGFMKLRRNNKNHCGVASEAYYPLV